MEWVFVVDHVYLEVKYGEICYCASVPFVVVSQLLVTSLEFNSSFPLSTTSIYLSNFY